MSNVLYRLTIAFLLKVGCCILVPTFAVASETYETEAVDRECVHTHLLTVEATPIERVATGDDAVWDLSQQTKAGIPAAIVKAFGDTLLSETVLGQRRWYSLKPDSCCLIKEESRYHYLLPDSLAETFTVAVAPDISSSKALQTESPYFVTGLHTLTFPIIRRGRCVSDGPVKGRLIVAEGDTIPAYMTRETLKYAERIFPDTLETMTEERADTLRHTTVTRWRWYTHGNVPVAVQTQVRGAADGQDETRAFLMDYSEDSQFLCEEDKERKDETSAQEPFRNVEATWNNGQIHIELDASRPVEIMFDMISDTGISQRRAVIPAEGHVSVSIDCGHPVPGRYVVVLSTSDYSKKIFVFVK